MTNWFWQGCCVALVTAVVLRLLDRASSRVRYLVCWVSMSIVLVQPLMSTVPLPVAPSSLPTLTLTSPLSVPLVPSSDSAPVRALLLALWGIWLLVHVRQGIVAVLANHRRRARYAPFPQSVERRLRHWRQVKDHGRRARLVLSDQVRAAAVVGCGSPVIAVAPLLVEHLTADELDRIVIHEWAHVQRRDDLANLAQFVTRALAGWHPALWWLDRRLQAEREIACDELAVSLTGSAKAYASCLVKLVGLTVVRHEAVPALGAISSSSVADRVRRIVSYRRDGSRRWSATAAAMAITLLIGVSLSIGSFRLVEAVAPSMPGHMVIELPSVIVGVPVSHLRSPAPAPTSTPGRVTRSITPAIVSGTGLGESHHPVSPDLPSARVEVDTSDTVSAAPALLPATSIQMPSPPQVTPWAAAADAGTALGQRSKEGGLATAAFFTRLGKRVANSF